MTDGQGMARLIELGPQRGQPLIAHQHQEADFGEIGGGGGIEAASAVLDGVEPVGRQGAADRQLGAGQRLWRQSLNR